MGAIYFSIALLVLYGDIVKRFLPAEDALAALYALALLVLVVVVLQSRGQVSKVHGHDARLTNFSTIFLIAVYVAQFCSTYYAPLDLGLNHLLYMVIPLAYVVVIQNYCPHFDLSRLAQYFLVLMIPVNAVGVIQYLYDPNFLISRVYDVESGGVITRNFLYGGTFQRLPSIFASADRYSAMGLMQFYLSLALLTAGGQGSNWRNIWIAANLGAGMIALGIAGARSRILLVLVLTAFMALVYFIPLLRSSGSTVFKRKMAAYAMFIGTTVLAVSIILIQQYRGEEYPILRFLQQSFSERDIDKRTDEALMSTLPPDDVSLFGDGLGTIGVRGKPGEFGIQSMWLESGLVWGSLLLFGFAGLMVAIARRAIGAAFKGQAIHFALNTLPLMVLVTALLTGLTAAFELSSGILLACAIATGVRMSPVVAVKQ